MSKHKIIKKQRVLKILQREKKTLIRLERNHVMCLDQLQVEEDLKDHQELILEDQANLLFKKALTKAKVKINFILLVIVVFSWKVNFLAKMEAKINDIIEIVQEIPMILNSLGDLALEEFPKICFSITPICMECNNLIYSKKQPKMIFLLINIHILILVHK